MEFFLFKMPMLFIIFVAAVLALILTLVNRAIVDQRRMKEIQTEVFAYNKKLMKATKEQNKEELAKLEHEKAKIMELQSEMMKMQMPMFAAILPFFVVFFLLRELAESMQWSAFVQLPFNIPVLGIGSSFTWLGWYIMCSLPMTTLFKKLLDVR